MSSIELAEIFKKHRHLLNYLPKQHYKAVNAIVNCRTSALGGHQISCKSCDYKKQAFNSCRNRHCPKCQFTGKNNWVEKRTDDLLPCPYFHVVFTIPGELRPLFLQNKKICYDFLFESAKETLKEVSETQYKNAGDLGFIGVLHTWSQTLIDHPHVHFIVPGGFLSKDKRLWIKAKEDYLLPVKVLSQVFRAKLLEKLEFAHSKKELKFYGDLKILERPGFFRDLMIECTSKPFVVDSRKPFSGPKAVIRYLSQYTHRIAISNYRILKLEDDQVYFKYRDPKDPTKKKIMKLHVFEFMRRFLLHILPSGFMRIRHYGILGSRSKAKNIVQIRKLCNVKHLTQKLEKTWKEILKKVTGVDPDICPNCKTKTLTRQSEFLSRFSTA